MHATAYLKEPEKHAPGPMVVLGGSEPSLKHSAVVAMCEIVLGADDDGASLTRFAGKDADLTTVRDELLTVSMWGDCRVVLVDEADEFISAHRAGLEQYLQKPAKKSVLILDVSSWRSNTRLAKAVAKAGFFLDCSPLKGGALLRWTQETARDQYGKQLTRDAAVLLTELAGSSLGLLEQEISKLVSYVGDQARIGVEDVRTLVGGWKAETTWTMIDALRTDNLGLALECLEKLLVAGEASQRILGGINSVFRKLVNATELARQGVSLNAALAQAGVFYRDVESSNRYLRRIGRPKAELLLSRLLEADGNLKGGSRLPERLQLEQLLVHLSGRA